ncbi:MAG: hypothetical protein Q9226_001545 [Calogaya cf. arnoldii]
MAGPIDHMSSQPSLWDPTASSAEHPDHTTSQDFAISTVTASTHSNVDPRETPALLHGINMRTSLENLANGIYRPQINTQERDDMTSRSQGPTIDAMIPPSAHKGPPPPMRGIDSSSCPTGKSNSRARTSIFGILGRNRKDPGDTARDPISSVVPQLSSPAIRRSLDTGGHHTQRQSKPRASTEASISTQDVLEQRSPTDSSSTGDNTSIFGERQAGYHANQDAKSFVSSNTSRTSQDTEFKRRSFKQPMAPSTITIITANRDDPSASDLLPSEANKFSGFCKGAWRLQIGDHKKALQERQRPISMYSNARFWQCKFCKLEGPLFQLDKKTKGFDQQIMVSEGIQFRWVFLFKSHVECKDANPNPLRSTFGCMLCCAEGRGTPVFRGAQALMEHMQEHRIRLPVGDVLERMNVLIEEKAPPEADFDINLDAKVGITI